MKWKFYLLFAVWGLLFATFLSVCKVRLAALKDISISNYDAIKATKSVFAEVSHYLLKLQIKSVPQFCRRLLWCVIHLVRKVFKGGCAR